MHMKKYFRLTFLRGKPLLNNIRISISGDKEKIIVIRFFFYFTNELPMQHIMM